MSAKIKKISRFSILTALLVFFMYLAFRDINFMLLLEELKKTNYFLAFIAMLIGVVVGSWVRALRWKYLLDPLKKDIGMNNLFSAVMIGYLMNALIPRSGEVARPVLLAQKEGISKASTFGTIVVERIFDMLAMFAAFGFCLFFFREKISEAFAPYDIEAIALWTSLVMLAFLMFVVLMLFNLEKTEDIAGRITKKILPARLQEKVHKIFISLITGFSFAKHPKSYFKIFATTVMIWLLYALILVMMSFAQTLPLPGNSAGTFYLFTKTALVTVYGINPEVAIGYAIVQHLLGFIGILVIGFYYSIKENYKFNTGLNDSIKT
ncbi:MAG: lysylphosphatidylglycerol synthase transmembrane domain-containing protein [Ignavibacteriae bacterium]|nr:lysylphosphatidylglycerol synthase transmembrane domain-containing protein [Ignavibacteriota bacterium]